MLNGGPRIAGWRRIPSAFFARNTSAVAAGADRGGYGRGTVLGSRHQRRWLRLAQNHAFGMRVNVEGRRAEKTY
jgi:hypothetical protein